MKNFIQTLILSLIVTACGSDYGALQVTEVATGVDGLTELVVTQAVTDHQYKETCFETENDNVYDEAKDSIGGHKETKASVVCPALKPFEVERSE